MSNRGGHVDVYERRLRPIYDCLDYGNNKKALQEADRVLKKQKDFQCAKVLKGLALLRLGRHDESTALVQEVHSQHPSDDATLHAMAICYREVNDLDMIVDMYENAHKVKSDSEEVLSALFMAYVRLGNYKKQKDTAILLHKLKPNKNPYYFWAVMSIVMQALSGKDEKISKDIALPLAERMTQKYVNENKIEAEAEVQMYLMILELQSKHREALDLIQSSLGDLLVSDPSFRTTKTAELHVKLGNWAQANCMYKALLKEYCDHWLHWMSYIDSFFHLLDMDWKPEKEDHIENEPDQDIDFTVDLAIQFVHHDVKKSMPKNKMYRGPYLAEMELCRRLKERNNEQVRKLGPPLDLMLKYFELFGDRQICFSDVRPYLHTICDSNEQEQLIEKLQEMTCKLYPTTIKEMQRHMTRVQISRCLRCHDRLSTEEKIVLAKDLIDRHKDGLKFGAGLLETDVQPSDNYLIIAVHILVDIWLSSGKHKLVWQIIMLLESGLCSSPSNHQMKLLLIQLYCRMGVFGPCRVLCDALEIKHIMIDTLGYFAFNHVSRLGHFAAASSMYSSMLRVFMLNHKETAEYLISSYKFGSFTKVYEFVKFREMLQNSVQFATATAEGLMLDMILEPNTHTTTEQAISYMEIDPDKDRTVFEELSDNRDLSVMYSWDPPDKFDLDEIKRKSFTEEKAWLKLRNLLLRLLAGAVSLGQQIGPNDPNKSNNGVQNENHSQSSMAEILQDLLEQFKEHVKTSSIEYPKPTENPLQGPHRTRISCYTRGSHGELIANMLENVLYINKLYEHGMDQANEESEERLRSVVATTEELVSENVNPLILEDEGSSVIAPDIVEQQVLLAETFSHIAILAGVCHKILKVIKSKFVKKNRKKKEPPITLPPTFQHFTEMVSKLEDCGKRFHKAVCQIDPVFLAKDLGSLKLTDESVELETVKLVSIDVWEKVEASYQLSSKELSELLHKKLHYLNKLKL